MLKEGANINEPNYTLKVYQHLTGTLLKNLITDIKCTENVSVMV